MCVLRTMRSRTRYLLYGVTHPKYSIQYYVNTAKQLEKLGVTLLLNINRVVQAHAAFQSVKRRARIGIPIHFHTHDTSGANAASILKAAQAGVDASAVLPFHQ